MAVDIRETPIGGSLRDFLNVVDHIYRDDPCHIRPLDIEMKDRLSLKNPFFQHGDGVIFTAHRHGYCVGRCTAQIDHLHLKRYDDGVGFFGFVDTIDDDEVARELLAAAASWLKARGMKRMLGPFSLYVNEEVGILVEGFEYPPSMMMAHSRPWQGRIAEACGLEKE